MKQKNKLIILLAGLYILFAGLTGCKDEVFDYPPSEASIYEIIFNDNPNYSLLRAIINRADLKDLLSQTGDVTLFAPINQAFTEAGYTAASIELTPKDVLTALIKNHIVQGKITIKGSTGNKEINSFANKKLLVQGFENKISFLDASGKLTEGKQPTYYVNGVDIIKTDIKATNGNIQSVNRVLTPASVTIYAAIAANPNLSLLKTAIDRANLASLLSGTDLYTLFAPNNVAFAASTTYTTAVQINAADPAVLATFLRYHLLQGPNFTSDFDSIPKNMLTSAPAYFSLKKGTFSVAGKDVIRSDMFTNGIRTNLYNANSPATNGVIHIIPQVLRPGSSLNTLQTIAANPNLTYMAAAIAVTSQFATTEPANDMSGYLSNTNLGKVSTLYAPTNAAFIAAGYPTIASINAAAPLTIVNLIKHHILSQRLSSGSFVNNDTATTLYFNTLSNSYSSLTITTPPYKVKGASNVAAVTVSSADNVTTNGIVNIIDQVLTP
jgi:transforming growth factor-beta-induced protein